MKNKMVVFLIIGLILSLGMNFIFAFWVYSYNKTTIGHIIGYQEEVLPEGTFIESWTAGIGGTALRGVATDNNFIWLSDFVSDEVYKYEMDGTPTGESFDTSSQSNDPYGIETDGEFFWISDPLDREVYKYFLNGTYTGFSFDTSSQTGYINGIIIIDETQIWVVDYSNDDVDKYWMDGTHISNWIPSEGIASSSTMTSDNNYIWFGDVASKEVDKYWKNGTYITSWAINSEQNKFVGAGTNGKFIWISDHIQDKVYKYALG